MILNKKSVLILFLGFFAFTGKANSVKISGIIKNSDSIQIISGAQISIASSNQFSLSTSSGRFEIEAPLNQKFNLLILNIGYTPFSINLFATKDTFIEVYLQEKVNQLDPVLLMTKKPNSPNLVGSSTYISPKELETFNYTDPSLTLRNVPGIQIQQEDGFGLRPNIGLRATGVERSSKITLMEDGVLAAPAPYAAPSAYYFPSIARMEGIEIVKGSSQIQYGPFTTGGAINFISATIPKNLSGSLLMNYGSFNTKNLLAKAGFQNGNIGFVIQSLHQSSDGFKNLGAQNTGFIKSDYLIKFRIQTSKNATYKQSLNLKVGQTTERSNETYLGLNDADFENNPFDRYAASQNDLMKSKQEQISLHHQIKFSSRSTLSTTAYYQKFWRNWYKLNHLTDTSNDKIGLSKALSGNNNFLNILQGKASQGNLLWLKANNRSYYSKGVQTEWNYKLGTRKKYIHHIQVGARMHQDQIDRFQWQDAYSMMNSQMFLEIKGTPGSESNRVETATAFSSYINYQFKTSRFELKPGMRMEHIEQVRKDYGKTDIDRQGTNISMRSNNTVILLPGLGMHFDLLKGKEIFLGVHRGFAPGGSQEGTSPENSINYELGAEVNKKFLNAQLIGFYSDYKNLLGSDLNAAGGTGSGDLFNGGSSTAYGIEFMATTTRILGNSAKFNLPITVGYTFTQAQFNNNFNSNFEPWGNISEGDFLPYLAPHQANINLSLEHAKYSIHVNTKYTDAMRVNAGQENIQNIDKIPSSIFLDLSMKYTVNPKVYLQASIINLTNNNAVVSNRPYGLRPAMPMMMRLGLQMLL